MKLSRSLEIRDLPVILSKDSLGRDYMPISRNGSSLNRLIKLNSERISLLSLSKSISLNSEKLSKNGSNSQVKEELKIKLWKYN